MKTANEPTVSTDELPAPAQLPTANSGKPAANPPRKDRGRLLARVALAALAALLAVTLLGALRPGQVPVPYSQVFTALSTYSGYTADLDDASGRLQLSKDGQPNVLTFVPRLGVPDIANQLEAAGVEVKIRPVEAPSAWVNMLMALIPVLLIIGFLTFFMRGKAMGIPGFGLGKKSGPVEVPDTRFSDVAGAEEAIADLAEVVQFLHDPQVFLAAGAVIPRGFLLVGPPGTGKTLLARAVAGEAGVPFFAISGSDLVEMFVGLGARRVRELFAKANEHGKAIIFIDEIDAVGKSRTGGGSHPGNDEREGTLNQLLVEMDGFDKSSTVIVLAATNRADVLDSALVRPGRFDRTIVVPTPDRAGRVKLLALYAKNKDVDPDVNWESMARRTAGMTGADIGQLMNEAAMCAARRGVTRISAADVEAALQTTALGRARHSAVMTETDRSIAAWHEAGHTVAALCTDKAPRPVSVTIIPRGPSGGATWMEGAEDEYTTRSSALARLVVAMGGRAAEEVLLHGDFTHGAQGDLQQATQLATGMVTQLGMAHTLRFIAPEALFSGGADTGPVSEMVEELMSQALESARVLMGEQAALLAALAEELLDKETLTEQDLARLSERWRVRA